MPRVTLNLKKNMLPHNAEVKGRIIGGDYGPNGALSDLVPDKEVSIRILVNEPIVTSKDGKDILGYIDEADIEYDLELPDTKGWIPWKDRNRLFLRTIGKAKARYNGVEGWVYIAEKSINFDDIIKAEIERFNGKLSVGQCMNIDVLEVTYDNYFEK
jgi:hypothetical protein